MDFWLQILVILCLSNVLVLCQFPISGPCPQVNPVANVTAESLSGVWFISASIPYFFQINEKCGFYNLTQMTADGLYSFEKHYVNNLTGNASVYYGTLDVKPNGQVELGYNVDGNMYPLSFDIVEVKTDTIILYACNECGFFSDYGKGIYVIVLTKLQYPSCETTEAAMTFVVNMGVERDFIVMQDQNDCPNC